MDLVSRLVIRHISESNWWVFLIAVLFIAGWQWTSGESFSDVIQKEERDYPGIWRDSLPGWVAAVILVFTK